MENIWFNVETHPPKCFSVFMYSVGVTIPLTFYR